MRIPPVERHLFLEAILVQYGYDFRQYAEASLDRRLAYLLQVYKSDSLIDLLKIVISDADSFRKILGYLTINTTEFFRDPTFFKSLREVIFPVLRTYSRITIWSAGCSTGEEVISLAIALREEGLDHRSTIYATDISPIALKAARDGIYESSCIPLFNRNYSLSGGTLSPSQYYTAEYGLVRFSRELIDNVVFSEHNLATDSAFLEANLILCRNVLIYFTRDLRDRALELFSRSLVHKGFLALGSKESLKFSKVNQLFTETEAAPHVYTFNSLLYGSPLETTARVRG